MKKVKLEDCIAYSKITNHLEVKEKILPLIDSSIDKREGYTPISKLDFPDGDNFEREWVKTFHPYFYDPLKNIIKYLGYHGFDLKQIWYQQYLKGSSHPWHTHGSNFTGVYYLEHPEGSPSTEVISPYSGKKHCLNMVSEGDFVVFPSHWIHRGPPNHTLNRKTIISYNLDVLFDTSLVKV